MEMVGIMNVVPLLQAAGAGQYMFFITLGIVFLIFYVLLIRPQRKEQKEIAAAIAALKKGDKVITIGGIHGMVSLVKERTIILKVDEGCKIEMSRNAIATVLKDVKEGEKAEVVGAERVDSSTKTESDTQGKGSFFSWFNTKKKHQNIKKDDEGQA